MKNFILSLICILGLTIAAQAQSSDGSQSNAISLQKQQVMQIQKTHQSQMQSIEQLKDSDKKTYLAKTIEIHESTDALMKAIMDEKQWAQYNILRKERMKMLRMQQRAIK